MESFERELSASEIISKGLLLFRRRFTKIVVPLFFGAIITAIIRLFFTYRLAPLSQQFATLVNATQTNSTNIGQFLPVAQLVFGYTVLEDLAVWIVAAPFFALAVKVAYEATTKGAVKMSEAFSAWLGKLTTLLFSGLIVGFVFFTILIASIVGSITVYFGLIFLVVPAIIFIIMSMMFLPAIILENKSALSSLGRSRKLVSKRWRKVFIVALIGLIMNFLIGTIFGGVLFFLNPYQSAVAEPFYSLFSDVLGVSFLVVLYQSLLIKEKGELTGSLPSGVTPP